MKDKRDCGPAALAWVFFILWLAMDFEDAYARVMRLWPGGWKNADSLKDDVNDLPDDHRLVIEAAGKFQTMVTLDDILTNKYGSSKVICLMHLGGVFYKHWVVVDSATEDYVRVHWGNGNIATFKKEDFVKYFTASEEFFKLCGKCAYTVSDTAPKLSWWQSFRRWFLGLIAKL